MVQNLVQAGKFFKKELNSFYSFFTILTDVLGLTKAIILLNTDFDKTFKPWCSIGFDQTSLLQLRISQDQIIFPNQGYLLDEPANLPLSGFFSSKDYGTIEQFLILPIFRGHILSGIFVIADNPYLSIVKSERDMILAPVQDLFRQLIENHSELCAIPPNHFPVNVTEIANNPELRKQLLDQRNVGKVIDFEFRESVSYLLKEYPALVAEAAYTDIRLRLLSNLQYYIQASFLAPGHCYIWLHPSAAQEIDTIIRLCAIELSESMISAQDFTDNITACMKNIPLNLFLNEIQSVVII